jgi:GTPase SAR1 family protein
VFVVSYVVPSQVLVLGDPATGKTSIIRQYVSLFTGGVLFLKNVPKLFRYFNGKFSNDYKPTIGVDFLLKQLTIPSKQQIVRVQLWDIAGQDRFSSINRAYYKEAVGAMIVFDVTKPKTFESVAKVTMYTMAVEYFVHYWHYCSGRKRWTTKYKCRMGHRCQ